jgi:hypothetical protein
MNSVKPIGSDHEYATNGWTILCGDDIPYPVCVHEKLEGETLFWRVTAVVYTQSPTRTTNQNQVGSGIVCEAHILICSDTYDE